MPSVWDMDNIFASGLPAEADEEAVRQIFSSYGNVMSVKVLGVKAGQGTNAALVRFENNEQAQWVVENVNGNIPQGLEEPVKIRFANPKGEGKGAGMGAAKRFDPYGGGPGKGGGAGKGEGKGPRCSVIQFIEGISLAGILPGGQQGAGKWSNDENTIFVGSLPPDTTDLDMYTLFSPFGPIAPRGSTARINKETGLCTGIGFVNYLDPAAASLAIMTLNGAQMPDGRTLEVKVKDQKDAAVGQKKPTQGLVAGRGVARGTLAIGGPTKSELFDS